MCSIFQVHIRPRDVIGYVKEATYGTCAFLAWDEEHRKLLVKSSLVENQDQSGNRYRQIIFRSNDILSSYVQLFLYAGQKRQHI